MVTIGGKAVVAQELIVRKPHVDLHGGVFGEQQIRMKNTYATSPRLLAYRQCVASQLIGKNFGNLGAVQQAFREAANHCKEQVKDKAKAPKASRTRIIATSSPKVIRKLEALGVITVDQNGRMHFDVGKYEELKRKK